MTTVHIWKLRSGIAHESAVKSIMLCAAPQVVENPNRRLDAEDFVKEIVRRADRCASSANANPVGMTMNLKNTMSDNELLEFRQCFNYTLTPDKPKVQLKLWRVSITEPKKNSAHTALQHNTLMILACTKAEAFVVAVAEDPKYSVWDIELKEIEGPFSNGQIIMDVGLRVVSDADDLLTWILE